jgi:dipeptidyl aminopeptidase/acylaminoacyl peptidase
MTEREIWVKSSIDGSLEPSLFYKAEGENRPLLVGLHTWSFDRYNQVNNLLPLAERYDFNLLLPEFRGSNTTKNPRCTEACGSALAKQDILDAIDYVSKQWCIDEENILLHGMSGGGHMAMLIAGCAPERFRAISAVVPITDLAAWKEQNPNYRGSVVACCTEDESELLFRSPITYLDTVARANIKIFHGKYDPVVPVSHSLNFYAEMMKKYPTSRVFLDIFDGGHSCDLVSVMHWLTSQIKKDNLVEVSG